MTKNGASSKLVPQLRRSSARNPCSWAISGAPGISWFPAKCTATANCNLSATGSWHGFIQAQQAIVAGKITGGLAVKDKLEIGYTAVIRGKVSARTIAIAKGAIVDGDIEVTSGAPVLQFEEKREV
jgi:hypothetical protein